MKAFVLFVGLLVVAGAEACSPAFEERVSFDQTAAYEGELPPSSPVARVVSFKRGRPARRGENNCVETSYVTVAIRNDSPRMPFYFEFREVRGTAPELIFQKGLYVGNSNGRGERQFTFYWLELSRSQKPVDLQVEITPYTRSGIRGPSAVIAVSDREI